MSAQQGLRAMRWTYRLGRLLLGAAFIYAAILKLGSPQDFADSIALYHLLPNAAINLLALGLPFFELTCGILVLTGLFVRIGMLGIVTMLVLFMVALGAALVRGFSIDCGCFGIHSWLDSNPWAALARDAILLGLALYIYRQRLTGPQPIRQGTANK